MSKLETLLNDPASPTLTETAVPQLTGTLTTEPIAKPTAASNKANTLAAQDRAIAAASVGSAVFRSAAAYLAINTEFNRIPEIIFTEKKVKVALA